MAEMRVIIGAQREDVDACNPHIGFIVAGAIDMCVWEEDPDSWDALSRRQRSSFDPDGHMEWREITVTIPDAAVLPLFVAPDIEGSVVPEEAPR